MKYSIPGIVEVLQTSINKIVKDFFSILKGAINQCVPSRCGSEFEIATRLIRVPGGTFTTFNMAFGISR
jgi:hypothetical protein